MFSRFSLLFLGLFSFFVLFSQNEWTYRPPRPERKMRFRVMSWNVENLYDTLRADDADDSEFLPSSDRR